ncbi:MAG: transglutaminase family protein [Caulobacterales bacterium]
MPILSIHHVTTYRYRRPVSWGEHRMMFRPLESYDQRVLSSSLVISPVPSQLRHMHDVFGNCVGIAKFADRACELKFESNVVLEHLPAPAFADGGAACDLRGALATYAAEDMPDLARSIERQYPDPDRTLERWAKSFLGHGRQVSVQDLLTEMTKAIHSDFRYRTRLSGAIQTPQETLALRSGACRDYAMLMMEAVRCLGLAAQFVSGYVRTRRGEGLKTSRGGGHTHAWARVYLPACGWVEFDPTNGIVGNADLVRVAIARDPRHVLPLYGTFHGRADDYIGMDVCVDVDAIEERSNVALATN